MAKNRKSTRPKKNANRSVKGNNWLLYALAGVLALAIFVTVLITAMKLFQTEEYYVLNTNVSARTQITPEMLDTVVTSEGTAPEAAIGLGEVQTGTIYSQYPLVAGDILTNSNVGGRSDISVGVPDSYVITNFSVGADDAVGGRIQRGYYFDMMVINNEEGSENDGAYYPFVNVLALDTTVDLSGATSAEAAETEEAHDGQTTQYVVGMSPGDAARLQHLVEGGAKIKLVLSPRANEYQAPQLSEYEGLFTYDRAAGPQDMGQNTDYTFTDVERDEFGVPSELPNESSCSEGNAKVTGDDCNAEPGTSPETENTTEETETSATTNEEEVVNEENSQETVEGN